MPTEEIEYISTGSTLLDCVLGGGFGLGRMIQVWGDSSTGKTQIAITAITNFFKKYPNGNCWYIDAESAFDEVYARSLGMPTERVNFWVGLNTVEDFEAALNREFAKLDGSVPTFLILDSLDALSSDKEMEVDMRDRTGYGGEKSKALSEFFRKLVRTLEKKRVVFFIVSQVRDNIAAAGYGPKTKPSSSNAVKFYASQRLELKSVEKIKRTIKGVERVTGIKTTAYCHKNKLGKPFRECPITITFGKGIQDAKDCIEYLYKADQLHVLGDIVKTEEVDPKTKEKKTGVLKTVKGVIDRVKALPPDKRGKEIENIKRLTKTFWNNVEAEFVDDDDLE